MPPRKKSADHPPIRATFEQLVASLGALSPYQVALAELGRHIADRIDADGPRNAALVKNYADLLGELTSSVDVDEGEDPAAAVLALIRNA